MIPRRIESGFVPESEQQPKYEILANKETRERLKERLLRFTEAVHDRKVDSLVFLDRGARPLSWMFQELWKGTYPAERVPEIKYVNIGTSSHVHRGVAQLLKTQYWGRYENGTNRNTSDLVKEPLEKAETEEKWITTNEIPREWQISMLEHLELSEELQEIFQKSFEDKSVLIVDDIGASGKSQMAALGFFSLAFPGVKQIESTSMFYSRQRRDEGASEDVDKKFIPWLQELGMAGVLELPDDALLSGAITAENIQRVLPVLEERIRSKQWVKEYPDDETEESLQRDLERKALYEHPEELLRRGRQLRMEMKGLAKEALADQKKKRS